MSTQRPIDPKRLLAQTAWVRRLALSLARDEASADDLVQETFVAALRRPPQDIDEDAGLRAWFATVVRNFAFRQGRETQRRTQRERLRSAAESSDAEERARELEELRTELFEHVVALPEESREVVLLHFFEELDSAEIARRLDVPDSTIRNRLRRALAELRERLERKHGSDWRNLCLFVLPSTGAKVAAGSGAAVAAAGGLWLSGGALAAVALALFLFWQRTGPSKLESSDAAALAALPASIDSQADAPPITERGAPLSERSAAPLAANTKPFLLYGRVLDAQQKPVKSASISLTDDRNQSTSSQDSPEGWYSFTALAPDLYDARIEADGGAPLVTQLDLRNAAGDTRRDFTLGAVSYVQVRLLRSDGSPWPNKELAYKYEHEYELCVVATADTPGKSLGPSGGGEYWRYGVGRYRSEARNGHSGIAHVRPGSSGVLEVFGTLPVHASLCQAERVLSTKLVDASTDSIDFVLDESFVRSLAARAVVHVVDERSGGPARGVKLELNPPWRGGGPIQTDEGGDALFDELPTGTLELELGEVWRLFHIDPGAQHDLGTVSWLPERRLRAQVLDSNGAQAAADIHCTQADTALDPSWCALRLSAQSDASGEFNWPSGPGFATTIVATRRSPTLEVGAAVLPRGEGLNVQVHMHPARLVGVRVKSDAIAYTIIKVTDTAGLVWYEHGGSLALPDGKYTFTVWIDGKKRYESTAAVDANTRSIVLDF